MNWVDGVILGIVIVYALTGLRRGFLAGFAEVLTIFVAFGVAIELFRPLGSTLSHARGWRPGITQGVAFVLLWLGVQLVLGQAVHWWHKRLPEETRKAQANRILGLLPAGMKGLVAAALFATMLSLSPGGSASSDAEASRLGPPMVSVVMASEKAAYNTFGDAISEIQDLYGPSGEVLGSRGLQFKTTHVAPDPVAEAAMLGLLNAEREKRHLKPLTADERLRKIARRHSADMLAKGYFAHNSPDGTTPFTRMQDAGITYRVAGENLALALTVETAHDRLMRSKGHRDNILDPEFGKVGIGAMRTDVRGTMFTQDFTD
ncbi:MAG TPA: CvpA family protein [Armatimonadota bacterium]